MADTKVFTVQPRFKVGDVPNSWSLIDGIFKFGTDLPAYGTSFRDAYLSVAWFGEPMTAGVFSTWVEKAQTINWKITGGRNNANYYANILHQADSSAGWSYHEGVCALDYLVTDKGTMEELGRSTLNNTLLRQLQEFIPKDTQGRYSALSQQSVDIKKLMSLIRKSTTGRVTSLQHVDSARMIKYGYPGMRWRYFPESDRPVFIPDENLIQLSSMPSPRDRFRGYGHCALTRILDAKNLMLGYLNYFRQEIGDLPPELLMIINGLSQTQVVESLKKYKADKQAKGNEEYGKIWWLGSDDPMSPVSVTTHSMTSPQKSFDYRTMVEWWMKLLALNVGEDVGEFWLLQRGESKTVQSVQSMKSKGKGVAKYLQEKERRYNSEIMPFGVRFEYDNPDDDADAQRVDILAAKINNLDKLAKMGVDREDPAYTIEQIRELATQWDVIPPEMTDEEVPKVVGAILKEAGEETWTVHRDHKWQRNTPLLKNGEAYKAEQLTKLLQTYQVPPIHRYIKEPKL